MMTLSRSGIPFTALILAGVPSSFGRLVKVLATNTSSGAVQYSKDWLGPVQFDWGPTDVRGQGGPNSSVCEMDVPTRLSEAEGDSFSFSFHGISVQLIMSSRPDHAPFSVNYDGQTYLGDTYSQIVHCGVAWSSPVAAVVGDHNITCTNHPYRTRVYLELLSIQYDDGSDLLATASQSTSQTPSGRRTDVGHDLSPGTVAGVAIGSAAFAVCVLLAGFYMWRRWRRAKNARDAVRPLHIAASAPETTPRKSLTKMLGTDGGNTHSTLPTLPPEGGAPETRLADGDIDRIALRMNEMLGVRAVSVGGREPDGLDAATALPPY